MNKHKIIGQKLAEIEQRLDETVEELIRFEMLKLEPEPCYNSDELDDLYIELKSLWEDKIRLIAKMNTPEVEE